MVALANRRLSRRESPALAREESWDLLPWADPYIAELIARHEAEAPHHFASDHGDYSFDCRVRSRNLESDRMGAGTAGRCLEHLHLGF